MLGITSLEVYKPFFILTKELFKNLIEETDFDKHIEKNVTFSKRANRKYCNK